METELLKYVKYIWAWWDFPGRQNKTKKLLNSYFAFLHVRDSYSSINKLVWVDLCVHECQDWRNCALGEVLKFFWTYSVRNCDSRLMQYKNSWDNGKIDFPNACKKITQSVHVIQWLMLEWKRVWRERDCVWLRFRRKHVEKLRLVSSWISLRIRFQRERTLL